MKDFLSPEFLEYLKEYSKSLCQDEFEADDLFQDTVLRIIENKDKYDRTRSIYPWAKVIMKNLFLNKAKKIKEKELDKNEDYEKNKLEEYSDLVDELRSILYGRNLDIAILIMEGYTIKDITKKLGFSESTIRSSLKEIGKIMKRG
jgi:RNA polymerase sigma-70 factor, ECF subfamily